MFFDTKNVISDTTFFEHAICAFLTIFSKTQHPQSIAVDFFNIGLILLYNGYLTSSRSINLRIPVCYVINALSSRLQLTDESEATASSNNLLRVKTRSRYVSEHWKFHKKEDSC